jgi:hypothetical protein
MKRVLAPSLPQGPQHYWSQMVSLSRKGGFTITDIHKSTSLRSRSTVKSYVQFCLESGFVEQIGERPTEKNRTAIVYRVCDSRQAPIQHRPGFADSHGRRAQQMWNTMRRLRVFTARGLSIAASTEEIAVKESTARGYLRSLAKAGYVAADDRQTGNRIQWVLLPAFNTGPLAPAIIQRGTVLVDRNLSRSVNLNAPETVGRAA